MYFINGTFSHHYRFVCNHYRFVCNHYRWTIDNGRPTLICSSMHPNRIKYTVCICQISCTFSIVYFVPSVRENTKIIFFWQKKKTQYGSKANVLQVGPESPCLSEINSTALTGIPFVWHLHLSNSDHISTNIPWSYNDQVAAPTFILIQILERGQNFVSTAHPFRNSSHVGGHQFHIRVPVKTLHDDYIKSQ